MTRTPLALALLAALAANGAAATGSAAPQPDTPQAVDLATVHVRGQAPEHPRDSGLDSYGRATLDRKSTRLNSSHPSISYAVFCLKKKKQTGYDRRDPYSTDDSSH